MNEMTIDKVIENLNNTIEGKEILKQVFVDAGKEAFAKLVQINIDELSRIRDDLVVVRNLANWR